MIRSNEIVFNVFTHKIQKEKIQREALPDFRVIEYCLGCRGELTLVLLFSL